MSVKRRAILREIVWLALLGVGTIILLRALGLVMHNLFDSKVLVVAKIKVFGITSILLMSILHFLRVVLAKRREKWWPWLSWEETSKSAQWFTITSALVLVFTIAFCIDVMLDIYLYSYWPSYLKLLKEPQGITIEKDDEYNTPQNLIFLRYLTNFRADEA